MNCVNAKIRLTLLIITVSVFMWRSLTPVFGASVNVPTDGAIKSNADLLVSNIWIDVPLLQVLRDISMDTGVSIIPCPHILDPLILLDASAGKPLRDCLQDMLSGRGFFVHEKGNKGYIIFCGSSTCPTLTGIAEARRVELKYISAKHLRTSLPKSLQEHISTGERENEVLLYTLPEISQHIMEIVAKLDVPRQQIVLEVLVIEIWEEASEEFGLDWEYSDNHNSFSMQEGLGFFTGLARYTSIPQGQLMNLAFTLRALIKEEKATIRSRPSVATLDGEEAVIDVSLEEYFSIITDLYGAPGRVRTDLQIIKSGVSLKIKPHLGNDGDITVDITTEVSDVAARQNQIEGNTAGNLPIIRRRMAKTRVRVKDGDAIVIGGLVETQQRLLDKSVPILSSIPLIGALFKAKENTTINKEVLIFITPRLINQGQNAFLDRHNTIGGKKELDQMRKESARFKDLLDTEFTKAKGDIK